jgi:ribosomal protein L11 methyltransferase
MYQPLLIGEHIRIVPPGTVVAAPGRLDIVMARGAFGSGEHETTASCLDLLATLPRMRNARVLDVGSGTGILAIAALLLGAGSACCVDICPQAVESARHNCELNSLDDRVNHLAGTLGDIDETSFDLILANIYGDILLDIAPAIVARARSGANILLSGILWEYNFDVRQAFERRGCRVLKNRLLEEFSTVLLVNG